MRTYYLRRPPNLGIRPLQVDDTQILLFNLESSLQSLSKSVVPLLTMGVSSMTLKAYGGVDYSRCDGTVVGSSGNFRDYV